MRNVAVSRKRDSLGKVCNRVANVNQIFPFFDYAFIFRYFFNQFMVFIGKI